MTLFFFQTDGNVLRKTSCFFKDIVMKGTIFAPATAAGKAGVAVVRISGPEAHQVAERMCGKKFPDGASGSFYNRPNTEWYAD